ncbi:transposase [Candidatus Sumerlaeota bacterium]|nr:transposase [Candidatus Sumerlaeota bacterium]
MASRPGSLIHADFKTFGVVSGGSAQTQEWLRGCIVIDSFTSFATVLLAPEGTGEAAVAALTKFRNEAPFDDITMILTDNGKPFTSEVFMGHCLLNGVLQRTTRLNHPWSNGKVEALNKTLKYQCFPAICTGESLSLSQVQLLADTWMSYYNSQRAHTGHMNRGLPPLALYALWRKAPGDYVEKLVHLNLISLDDLARLRYLGQPQRSGGDQRLRAVVEAGGEMKAPPAFVIDGPRFSAFIPAEQPAAPDKKLAFRPAK